MPKTGSRYMRFAVNLLSYLLLMSYCSIVPLELCLLHFNKVDARKQENAAQKWHILKNASFVLVG